MGNKFRHAELYAVNWIKQRKLLNIKSDEAAKLDYIILTTTWPSRETPNSIASWKTVLANYTTSNHASKIGKILTIVKGNMKSCWVESVFDTLH